MTLSTLGGQPSVEPDPTETASRFLQRLLIFTPALKPVGLLALGGES
jgi:hypothetical protein